MRIKISLLHVLIVPLVVILVFFECFNTAVAESNGIIAYLNNLPYSDFDDLIDDLEDYEDKTVVIDMYTDWDASKDSQFDDLLGGMEERRSFATLCAT